MKAQPRGLAGSLSGALSGVQGPPQGWVPVLHVSSKRKLQRGATFLQHNATGSLLFGIPGPISSGLKGGGRGRKKKKKKRKSMKDGERIQPEADLTIVGERLGSLN